MWKLLWIHYIVVENFSNILFFFSFSKTNEVQHIGIVTNSYHRNHHCHHRYRRNTTAYIRFQSIYLLCSACITNMQQMKLRQMNGANVNIFLLLRQYRCSSSSFCHLFIFINVIDNVVQEPQKNWNMKLSLYKQQQQRQQSRSREKTSSVMLRVQLSLPSNSWTMKFVDINKLNVLLLFIFSSQQWTCGCSDLIIFHISIKWI